MLQLRIRPVYSHGQDATPTDDGNLDLGSPSCISIDPEDVLVSFLPHLFPDEASACLGDPGQTLIYSSPRYGDLRLVVPNYPTQQINMGDEAAGNSGTNSVEDSRRLFAHYLWGAALVTADNIERAAAEPASGNIQGLSPSGPTTSVGHWIVKGQRVLELGAGVALPSLISALAGADEVVVTDHPSSSALREAIQANISENIPQQMQGKLAVFSHEWGILPDQLLSPVEESMPNNRLDLDPSTAAFARTYRNRFTRIICADCLWMKDQHENLIQTLLWFLAPPEPLPSLLLYSSSSSRPSTRSESRCGTGGLALVVAGFHTGREIVASFFTTAVAMGLVVEEIWERDLNANSDSADCEEVITREWVPFRPGEGPENRARWCVVSCLRKMEDSPLDSGQQDGRSSPESNSDLTR